MRTRTLRPSPTPFRRQTGRSAWTRGMGLGPDSGHGRLAAARAVPWRITDQMFYSGRGAGRPQRPRSCAHHAPRQSTPNRRVIHARGAEIHARAHSAKSQHLAVSSANGPLHLVVWGLTPPDARRTLRPRSRSLRARPQAPTAGPTRRPETAEGTPTGSADGGLVAATRKRGRWQGQSAAEQMR